jgi:hypothetical protein
MVFPPLNNLTNFSLKSESEDEEPVLRGSKGKRGGARR